jgi:hypothetical protein
MFPSRVYGYLGVHRHLGKHWAKLFPFGLATEKSRKNRPLFVPGAKPPPGPGSTA